MHKSSTTWPVRRPSLLILTSLSDGPQHGYAIMTDVAAFSGVRMEPGTCTARWPGWSAAAGSSPLASAERRRPYQITAACEEALTQQLRTMQQIVRVGFQRTATA